MFMLNSSQVADHTEVFHEKQRAVRNELTLLMPHLKKFDPYITLDGRNIEDD